MPRKQIPIKACLRAKANNASHFSGDKERKAEKTGEDAPSFAKTSSSASPNWSKSKKTFTNHADNTFHITLTNHRTAGQT